MSTFNIITYGIGPKSSVPLLLLDGLYNGSGPPALTVVGGIPAKRRRQRFEYILPNGLKIVASSEDALAAKLKAWRIANDEGEEKQVARAPDKTDEPKKKEPEKIPKVEPIEFIPQPIVEVFKSPFDIKIPQEMVARLALAAQIKHHIDALALAEQKILARKLTEEIERARQLEYAINMMRDADDEEAIMMIIKLAA